MPQVEVRAGDQIILLGSTDGNGIVNVAASDKRTGERASTRITLSSGLSEREIKNIIDRGVASRVQTAAIPAAAAPPAAANRRAPVAPAPKPAPMPAPAMIEDDEDALIPIESDFGAAMDDLRADLLDDTPGDLAAEPLEVDPDATTQPDLETSAPSTEFPAAPIRSNEVMLSEDDLAALDTSDLDAATAEKDSLFDTSGVDLSAGDPEPRD